MAASPPETFQLTVNDEAALRIFFTGLSYRIIDLTIRPRTIRIRAEREARQVFIKLAATPPVSERLENETAWNRAIRHVLAAEPAPFTVPELLETGRYRGLLFIVTPFYSGSVLAQPWQQSATTLRPWLDRIIQANYWFLQRGNLLLPRDQGSGPPTQAESSQRLLAKTRPWLESLPNEQRQALVGLLDRLVAIGDYYQPSLNHHDFVPWHMLADGHRFILLDGENGTAYAPRFYDVAYFFHRVYTKAADPIVAKEYLDRLVSFLPATASRDFWPTLDALLASRIIGGFFDANNDRTDLAVHWIFLKEYLAGSWRV